MNKLLVITFAILLLPWTAQCQEGTDTPVDSTQQVSYPLWVMWRYEHDALKGGECGKLVELQKVEINKGLDVEIHLRDENKNLRDEIHWLYQANDNLLGENRSNKALLENQTKMTNHESGQKNKWKITTYFVAVAFILREVFVKD